MAAMSFTVKRGFSALGPAHAVIFASHFGVNSDVVNAVHSVRMCLLRSLTFCIFHVTAFWSVEVTIASCPETAN